MWSVFVILLFSLAVNGDYYHTNNLINIYRKNLMKMLDIINYNYTACDNFFQHACHTEQYNSSNYLEIDGMQIEQHVELLPPYLYNAEDRRRFFVEYKNDFSTKVGKMLRDLYDGCADRSFSDVIRGKSPSLWQRICTEIPFLNIDFHLYKHWPFVQSQWEVLIHKFELNWMKLAAQFAAHNIQIFIKIFFAQDTIYISPNEFGSCPNELEIRNSLRKILSDPQENLQNIHFVSYELLVLCRLLEGEWKIPNAYKKSTAQNNMKTLLEQNLNVYFEEFFSQLNFTHAEITNARKIAINMKRLNEIMSVLNATEPRILYNYLLWRSFEQLKYDDCFQLIGEWKQFLYTEYWNWNVFSVYFSKEVAMATYLLQTTRFQRDRQNVLKRNHWDELLTKKRDHTECNVKRIIQNYGDQYLNDEQLYELYHSTQFTQSNAFYTTLLALRNLRLKHSFRVGNIIDLDLDQDINDADAVDDELDINDGAYFMKQFLDFNILILKQPLYHYFATQNFQMWFNSKLLYSTDGYYTALDCLQYQRSLESIDTDNDTDMAIDSIYNKVQVQSNYNDENDEVKRMFIFYRAFIESYKDYNFWLQTEFFSFVEDVLLANFAMDSKRILFYAVTQLYCNRNDNLYSKLINQCFRNMPEFEVAFNCPTETSMNPLLKCMIKKCD